MREGDGGWVARLWARVGSMNPAQLGVRLLGRVGLPLLLFGYLHSYEYLRPTNAPRMMTGDWTTYIVSSNYLRGADTLTFPIAEVPGYLAPLGTNLAQTDSIPALMPVYRVLLSAFPDQPVQLLGFLLFAGIFLVFNAVVRFFDHLRLDGPWLWKEACALGVATIAVMAPFWNIQYGHPALFQQWIIIWALVGALRRCPGLFGGRLDPAPGRWVGLGPICVAAAVQPYLVPMVAIPALAPDLVHWRTGWRWLVAKGMIAVGAVLALGFVLGYVGGGGSLGSDGFGFYAADLATVLDPDVQSRFINDIPSTAGAVGGYGYPGLGGLGLLLSAIVLLRRVRRGSSQDQVNRLSLSDPRVLLFGAVGLMAVYAWMPRLHLFGRPVFHIDTLTDPLSEFTSIFRVNGRFIWVALWLALIVAGAFVMVRSTRVGAFVAIVACLAVQVSDVVPFPSLMRATSDVAYDTAYDQLSRERATGARSIQFQPPGVIPGCFPPAYPTFDVLGDVLLAAAVLDLPANSGYTARPRAAYERINCGEQQQAYLAGAFSADVAYVVPSGAVVPAGLRCSPPVTPVFSVCRTTSG